MEAVLAAGLKFGLVEPGTTLLFQIFNTLVLFAFLRWKLFGPVSEMLKKRTDRIKASFDEADTRIKQANALEAEYAAKLSGIKDEEAKILAEARLKATQRANDLIKHAEVEIESMKAHAQREINLEREKAINQLKDDIASIAILAASKVIDKELDAQQHGALIGDVIERVSETKWHN